MIRPALSSPQLSAPATIALIPLLLLTLAAAAVLGATYLYIVKPADERFARAQAAYQRAKLAQDQSQATRALHERVKIAQEKVELVWRALPSQDKYAALAMAISELGKGEHVSIPGMSYQVEKAEGGMPVKASLSFRVTGEYGAIYRFIHRLEAAESYLVIESLDAARADKTSQAASHLVVFNMTVATFLRPTAPTKDMS